jgi:hypothetical protein
MLWGSLIGIISNEMFNILGKLIGPSISGIITGTNNGTKTAGVGIVQTFRINDGVKKHLKLTDIIEIMSGYGERFKDASGIPYEVALFKMAEGDHYLIVSNSIEALPVPSNAIKLIAHTHLGPNSVPVLSMDDIDMLRKMGQRSTYIVNPHTKTATRVHISESEQINLLKLLLGS